jgi:Protein of unknown function (DUF2799)
MKLPLLAFTCLTLAACAAMDAEQCRGANWYDIGFRDGVYGLQRTDFVYGSQCSAHGVTVDQAAYGKGWQEGNWEFHKRKAVGGSE